MNDVSQLLSNLQASHFGVWVATSVWAYEIILALHAVGLAFLVGIMMVVDLRILGLAKAVPLTALRPAMRVVWGGFALQAASGISLFVADAPRFASNYMFRGKLASVFIGMSLAVFIDRSVLRTRSSLGSTATKSPALLAKALAALSLAAWLSAIVCGRLIAYHG